HLLAHAPDRAVEQRHLEVGHADMSADDLDHLSVGPRARPLVFLLADLDDAEPAVAAVGVQNPGARDAGRLWIDLVSRRLARQREAREVSAPVFVQQDRERRRPDHLDAGGTARLAARTVACQQVLRLPAFALPAVD